jgi:pSer/pThr/pTyr-binding forkhead associated (FHA) protein
MGYRDPTYEQTPGDLKAQIALEREGRAFLVYRNEEGGQERCVLGGSSRLTIGRDPACDVSIRDGEVSLVHAELVPIGSSWVVADDGLSKNGTFVAGTRVTSRRRLRDRDLIRVGQVGILFRDPGAARAPDSTAAATDTDLAASLTPAQRRVLVELCRPFGADSSFAAPAGNRAIAERLHVSLDAVKAHLRVLFERFGVDDLPQNEKRAQLADRALRSGAVTLSDIT